MRRLQPATGSQKGSLLGLGANMLRRVLILAQSQGRKLKRSDRQLSQIAVLDLICQGQGKVTVYLGSGGRTGSGYEGF